MLSLDVTKVRNHTLAISKFQLSRLQQIQNSLARTFVKSCHFRPIIVTTSTIFWGERGTELARKSMIFLCQKCTQMH